MHRHCGDVEAGYSTIVDRNDRFTGAVLSAEVYLKIYSGLPGPDVILHVLTTLVTYNFLRNDNTVGGRLFLIILRLCPVVLHPSSCGIQL